MLKSDRFKCNVFIAYKARKHTLTSITFFAEKTFQEKDIVWVKWKNWPYLPAMVRI